MADRQQDKPARSRLDQDLIPASSGVRAAEEARLQAALREVARPDSRFQWDLDFFIPDFEGSHAAAECLAATPEYRAANLIFVTPDNALIEIRRRCLADGKKMVLPSYGLTRGFLILDPAQIPNGAAPYAAWLDGIDYFGISAHLAALDALGPFDLVIAGAAAITMQGQRFGMGHRYLDIEWGLLAGTGLVSQHTPVASMVHPVQMTSLDLPMLASDIHADMIALPDTLVRTGPQPRPNRLDTDLLSPELAATDIVLEYLDRIAEQSSAPEICAPKTI